MDVPLIAILACMAGAAFFSGIETGLYSVHRLQLRHFVRQGSRRAMMLEQFLDHPDKLLGTALAGTNLCVVAASDAAAERFGGWAAAVTSPLMTLLLVVFAEYMPKAWFHSRPYERCATFAPLLVVAEMVLRPLSVSIIWVTRFLVPGSSRSLATTDRTLSRDDLKLLARQGEKDGVFSAEERVMIHRVFELSSKRARDIMIPREKMAFVTSDMPIPQFLAKARETRFTRMPVFDKAKNAFVGIANLFAVATAASEHRGSTVAGFARPPLLIPESAPVGDILPKLRRSRQPMCLVVNDRSEVTGLLTIEDILEEIVGQT
jgi:CBS domain containing-hemolysin-like protein